MRIQKRCWDEKDWLSKEWRGSSEGPSWLRKVRKVEKSDLVSRRGELFFMLKIDGFLSCTIGFEIRIIPSLAKNKHLKIKHLILKSLKLAKITSFNDLVLPL